MEKLELEKIANNIRKETISMIHNAKSGHPGGALSATDIFTYLYFNEMNVAGYRFTGYKFVWNKTCNL